MMKLTPELRGLLDDALINVAGGDSIADDELMRRFEEVMEILGEYLVAFGVGPDGQLNDLGVRIEELEDVLVRERMDQSKHD